MTTGADRDSERFAAAVEDGRTYAGAVSPGDEFLERELELVALLRESRACMAPSPDESARMRAKVMAAAATMVPSPSAEQDGTEHDTDAPEPSVVETTAIETTAVETNVVSIGSARGRHRFPRRAGATDAPRRHTALGVSAAAAVVLVALTGGGALFSRDALPGDTLYGVKQTTESGLVALAPRQDKAQRQLDVAATRMDEVQQLNASDAPTADRGSDISQALRGFNEQTAAASRTWLSGPSSGNTSGLTRWTNTQSQRLAAMRASMPASAQPDADASMRTLEQVRSRAKALSSRSGCDTVSTGQSDEFGPIPAKSACHAKDSTPGTNQVVPNVPTNGRASAPSLGTPDRSGSPLPSAGDATKPNTGPDLHLPSLPSDGSDSDGILPNRETTSAPPPSKQQQEPEPQPGLNLPLINN